MAEGSGTGWQTAGVTPTIDHRHLARLLAIGRVSLGVTLLVRPTVLRGWMGDAVDTAGGKVAVRGLGIRDAVIGAGVLRALDRGEPLQPWLDRSAAVDVSDVLATLVALPKLPRTAVLALAVAGGAAAVSLAGRNHVD